MAGDQHDRSHHDSTTLQIHVIEKSCGDCESNLAQQRYRVTVMTLSHLGYHFTVTLKAASEAGHNACDASEGIFPMSKGGCLAPLSTTFIGCLFRNLDPSGKVLP